MSPYIKAFIVPSSLMGIITKNKNCRIQPIRGGKNLYIVLIFYKYKNEEERRLKDTTYMGTENKLKLFSKIKL